MAQLAASSAGNEEFFSRAFLQALSRHAEPALAPFFAALALSVILVPVAIFAARRLRFIAYPEGERRIHSLPTPLLGGPALYIAFAAVVIRFAPHSWQVTGLLVTSALAVALFLIDDKFKLAAPAKLGFNVLVALVATLVFGYMISFIAVPRIGVVHLGLLAFPVTLAWLLGMQNTVNLLDGVDGLAAGVVAIVSVVLAIAAASRAQMGVVVLAACLAGACVGFLIFNFNPARIFMGDSGSQFLGIAVGMLSILGVAKVAVAFALVLPVLALAVPILDTGWAIVRRRRGGLSIAHADTSHIHHQLLDFGLSQRQACLLFYSATGILGAFGLMLFGHKRILSIAVVLLFVAISTLLGERLQGLTWQLRVPGLRGFLRSRAAAVE